MTSDARSIVPRAVFQHLLMIVRSATEPLDSRRAKATARIDTFTADLEEHATRLGWATVEIEKRKTELRHNMEIASRRIPNDEQASIFVDALEKMARNGAGVLGGC
jgi:hypothetical protein